MLLFKSGGKKNIKVFCFHMFYFFFTKFFFSTKIIKKKLILIIFLLKIISDLF